MRFVKSGDKEWAIVADGRTSPTQMDGHKGAVVFGPDGQALEVFEAFGKIHVEAYTGTFEPPQKS